jgi:hypothetical protein
LPTCCYTAQNPFTDPKHCGGCNQRCDKPGQYCHNGQCMCPPGQALCSGWCQVGDTLLLLLLPPSRSSSRGWLYCELCGITSQLSLKWY